VLDSRQRVIRWLASPTLFHSSDTIRATGRERSTRINLGGALPEVQSGKCDLRPRSLRSSRLPPVRGGDGSAPGDDPFRTRVAELLKRTYKSLGVPVVICVDLYPDLDTEARSGGRVLLTQGLLGQARYLVEHPGAPSKDEGMFTSGAATALRAYRKLVALHPQEQRPRWVSVRPSAVRRASLGT
jgi:hypothetical protein